MILLKWCSINVIVFSQYLCIRLHRKAFRFLRFIFNLFKTPYYISDFNFLDL